MKKYKCIYVSGGGKEYLEGIFVVKNQTEKRLTLEMIEEGYFAQYPEEKIRKIPIGQGKRTKFSPCVKEWEDGNIEKSCIAESQVRDLIADINIPIGYKLIKGFSMMREGN